ncbi:MAG: hypothetical protein R3F56_19660 [Planctomycetota bacterium]
MGTEESVLQRLATGELDPASPEARRALAADPELARRWQETQAILSAIAAGAPSQEDEEDDEAELARAGDRMLATARRELLGRRPARPRWPWLLVAALVVVAAGWWALWMRPPGLGRASPQTYLGGGTDTERASTPLAVSRQRPLELAWDDARPLGGYGVRIGERTWRCPRPPLVLPAAELASMPARVACSITWKDDGGRERRIERTLVFED